jgi:hypothetical protein
LHSADWLSVCLFCVCNPIEDFHHTETHEAREDSNEPWKIKYCYDELNFNLYIQTAELSIATGLCGLGKNSQNCVNFVTWNDCCSTLLSWWIFLAPTLNTGFAG